MRPTFLLFTNDVSHIELLSDEEAGQLFKAIFRYVAKGEEFVTDNRTLAVVFAMFKTKMDEDKERYAEIVEKRREAGRKGGEARWNSQNIANDSKCQQVMANDGKRWQTMANIANININNNNDNNINNNKANSNNKESKKMDAAHAATLTQKRKDAFYQSLIPFLDRYPAEMIRAFFDYWTEMNRSQTKMRFEQQQTWETSKRLATWANREKVTNNSNQRNNAEERRNEAAELIERLLSENHAD